jgi:hypothetical protein
MAASPAFFSKEVARGPHLGTWVSDLGARLGCDLGVRLGCIWIVLEYDLCVYRYFRTWAWLGFE